MAGRRGGTGLSIVEHEACEIIRDQKISRSNNDFSAQQQVYALWRLVSEEVKRAGPAYHWKTVQVTEPLDMLDLLTLYCE